MSFILNARGKQRACALLRASKSEVTFDGRSFRIRNQIASGLLPRLQKVMKWSTINPRTKKYRHSSHLQRVHRSCPTWGELHGIIVHEQIAHSCRAIANRQRLGGSENKTGQDPCVHRFLSFLEARHWIPIAAELPIGRDGLATAVDVVVLDRKGDIIAIEIKTGYENECYGPTVADKKIALGFRDCPQHRHELQLSATCLLMPISPDRAFIIRLCSKARGVEWREIRWWKNMNRSTELENLLFSKQKKKNLK